MDQNRLDTQLIIAAIKEFYEVNNTIYIEAEITFNQILDNNKRYLQVSYYTANKEELLNVIAYWHEENGTINDDMFIDKRSMHREYIKFTIEELEKFDRLGFTLDKRFTEVTGQFVEDWFGAQQ